MYLISVDLGAESGRVILGKLRAGKLTMEVVHRFPTGSTEMNGTNGYHSMAGNTELQRISLMKTISLS